MSGNSESDDWFDMLSPGAKTMVSSVNLRRHSINLERIQRIHLGIDSEPMEFSANTIADMLQQVADECDEDSAFTIHAVVNALRGLDEHHVLQLKRKRRGRFVSPTEREEQTNRNLSWLHSLAKLEAEGMQTEAAIAKISDVWKVSRAAVYAGIAKAEDFYRTVDQIANKDGETSNPRLANKRKG